MQDDKDVIEAVRSALRSEPRVALHDHPIDMEFTDGPLTFECPSSKHLGQMAA